MLGLAKEGGGSSTMEPQDIKLEKRCVHTCGLRNIQTHSDMRVHTHGTIRVCTYWGTDEHTDTCVYTRARKVHSIFF